MKLGVFSMPAHPPHRGYADAVEEDVDMLVLADELGFSQAWLGEHSTSIAQLDQMARGRFLWGVCAGAVPSDAVLFEVPADGAHRRVTQENIDQILKIWQDEVGGWSYRNEEFPQFNFTIPPREDWRGLPIARIGASCRDIYVADTDEQALREARRGSMARAFQEYFFPLVSSVGGLGVWKLYDDMPDSEITLDYLLHKFWIVGSPETVAQRLADIYVHTGGYGGLLMLAYDWEGENRHQWRHSMELSAQEVMPRLEDLIPNFSVVAAESL
jgi:alkanesulfonate monooxygenase SsuD/methylene tetrahydromethanopterin reductase-like flavin-dependent oxidoreductase (luciferase family)